MKELKVGERVTITLEAVEAIKSKRCDGCFFDRNGGCVAISLGMECVPKYRSDKKNLKKRLSICMMQLKSWRIDYEQKSS